MFGNCDLSSANIIIPKNPDVLQDELDQGISFIGYEFAMACPAAFDIANHFSEWAGSEGDYTLLPTRAVRHAFIEQYLHSCNIKSRSFWSLSLLFNISFRGRKAVVGAFGTRDIIREWKC